MNRQPLVTETDITRLARAACLRLLPGEAARYAAQTDAVLRELEALGGLSLPQTASQFAPQSAPEPPGSALPVEALRADEPAPSLPREELLRAGAGDGAYFASPMPWREGEG